MKMERSGISLYANTMTKLTIVGLTAIMFIGCNGGGGLTYLKLQKRSRNLMIL